MKTLGFVPLIGIFAATASAEEVAQKPVSYYKDIRPVFQAHCQGCHQPAKDKGGYVMTEFDRLIGKGDSEEIAVIPGKPDASYLIEQITPDEKGEAEMPRKGDPLHETEIALVRRWIAEGAKDDTPESAKQKYDMDNPPVYTMPPVITSIDFSPDGKLLAVPGFHEVLVYKADGSELLARLVGLSERIESVRFSPDGKQLAVTGGLPGRMGEVQVWDVEKKKLNLSVPATYDTVYGASWSPDGAMIAFGCSDNTTRAIDAKTGKEVVYMGSHTGWPIDTVFSMKGDYLVSVGRDMTAKLTKVDEQRFIDNITSITPKALKGGILAVTRHPKRDEILFGGADGVPKIYRMHRVKNREIGDDSNQLWNLPAMTGRIFGVDWSADGKRIVAGSSLNGKGAVHVYEINPEYKVPGDIDGILKKPTHKRNGGEWDKLNKYFADGVKTLAKLEMPETPIYAVGFSPDGNRVAAAGGDGKIRIYNAGDGALAKEFLSVPLNKKANGQAAR